MNVTKITKLTSHNAAALQAHADRLGVEVSKTTATFTGTPAEALHRVNSLRDDLKAEKGGRDSQVVSLVAVIGKLRKADADPTVAVSETPAPAEEPTASDRVGAWLDESVAAFEKAAEDKPKLSLVNTSDELVKAANAQQAADAILANNGYTKKADPKPAKKAPAKKAAKAAPAKKSAGVRAIPTEATNKARQAWIAEVGLDAYKKAYNSGWDNATYGQGSKKAESGEASVGYMDGYTDRLANPGKEGISKKWAALRSTAAPAKKVAAKKA